METSLLEEPDYKSYSLSELEEAYCQIDKEAYPERAKKLKQEIDFRLKEVKNPVEHHPREYSQVEEYQAPKGNWFKLHWQGLLPLGISYWLNVFAISFIVILVSPSLFQSLADSNASLTIRGLSIITFHVVITALAVWQLTGLYRSADKHTSRGGSSGWAMIAKLMVIIGIGRYCYDMNRTGIPFIVESGKLISGESRLPPLSIRVMNAGTEVELQGGLEFGTAKELDEILTKNPSIKIIHLNSVGGRIVEAKKLATLVKQKKLITYSKTHCLSACPLVFLAGHEKLLGESAKLGFHSASFGGVSGSEIEELNEPLLKQLKDAKVSPWFIQRVSEVNSNEVWNPSIDELKKAGVIDKIVDSRDYAHSGVKDWRNPNNLDVELQKQQIYKNLFEFDRSGYEVVRAKMIDGIKDGTPLNKLKTSVNNFIYVERINHYLQLGSDKGVIQYIDAQIAQMEYLRQDYPLKCAAYAYPEIFGQDVNDDTVSLLPDDIRDLENKAFNQLIRSLSETNYAVNEQEQTALITAVVEKMMAVDNSYADVLSNPINYKDQPEILCDAGLMLSKEINALPSEKAGSLIRSFYRPES